MAEPPASTGACGDASSGMDPGADGAAHHGLPYTVLSCSMSMDGYISSATGGRLILSNAADLDRVDGVRARCDAIMVGAATIRRDDPRLLVRDPRRVAWRVARGLPSTPVKVTLTEHADLDPGAPFFATGADKLVYCGSGATGRARGRLGRVATVVDGGRPVRLRGVLADLHRRGIRRLLVEGGGTVHTQFLVQGLADELHLVLAPVFVGDSRARRFVDDGRFPWHPAERCRLAEVRQIGDVVLVRYALSDRFRAGTFAADATDIDAAGAG